MSLLTALLLPIIAFLNDLSGPAPFRSPSGPTPNVPVPAGPIAPVSIPAEIGLAPPKPQPSLPFAMGLEDVFLAGADRVELDPVSDAEWERAAAAEVSVGCGGAPQREGFVRPLSPEQRSAFAGGWRATELGGGEVLWTQSVRTPDAYGTRLHFEATELGASELSAWAWNGDKVIQRGPYRDTGPRAGGSFWTASLPGDTAYIEVRGGQRPPEIELTEVVHYDRPLDGGSVQESGVCGGPSGDEHACQQDVMCSGLQGGLLIARDAVAQLRFMDNGQCFSCSGTLIADFDPTSQVLWFITAFHCINSQAVADTLEAVWLYQSQSCGSGNPNWIDMERNCGATLLETSSNSGGSDLAFLRLDGDLQPGVTFAGYNSGAAAGILTGIHHPKGAPKRLVNQSLSGLFTCTFAYDPFDYDIVESSLGMTEGGSSGSGLFNNQGQLLGQLSGKCCEAWLGSECEDASCSNYADWRSSYGESEESWPLIQKWLESGGTLHVDTDNTSSPWLGTPTDPYQTIQQALAAAWPGVRLLVNAGSYDEAVTLDVQVDTTGGTVVVGD